MKQVDLLQLEVIEHPLCRDASKKIFYFLFPLGENCPKPFNDRWNVAGSGWEIGRLLMSGKTLPDAVLIDDDGLIPDVTAGIASMPKPWPTVAGVVNFPALPAAHVPVLFGGFDIEALFEWCFRALCDPEMQHACTPYPAEVLFEDEWRARERSL